MSVAPDRKPSGCYRGHNDAGRGSNQRTNRLIPNADAPLLELRAMTKAFPGVQALSGVNLDVRAGEVHAVVGENGAGKSTLMKIVAGVYHPDGGTIRLGGVTILNDSPRQALERGISMIHQELNLAPNLSVAEN